MRSDEPDPTPAVLAEVERGIGSKCRSCGRAICGHEAVVSFMLGFQGASRCAPCLVRGLGRELEPFAQEVRERVRHRDCWRAGWRRADELEGPAADGASACLLARERAPAPARPAAAPAPPPLGADRFDAEWDAGDLGCGDLVLELRLRLRAMQGGQVLRLTARDPGAPQDLPAWCGLTGHVLRRAAHPTYHIERRKD
jgi:tRNA 2-thiouridine synthesizing protein A